MKYGLNPIAYDEEMISYVVDGEFLDNIFGSMPFESLGEKKYLYDNENSEGKSNSLIQLLIDSIKDSVGKHGIDTVIKILEEEESKREKKN